MSTQITLGEITIHRIVESETANFEATTFFPGLTPQMWEENKGWLQPRYVDAAGKVVLTVQSYVIATPTRTILVDTCVGNHKPRPARPFWNNMQGKRYEEGLARLGIAPKDVDLVMCTHLHVDHVGWNTRLENGRWVPTFPNARYLFSQKELAHWQETFAKDPASCPWIDDSVLPIVAARRADLIKTDARIDDDIVLLPTPGHTIDHFSVHVGQAGEDAIICGDMVHSPLQCRYPELGMRADHDSRQAGQSRRRVLESICDADTLLCTIHFPSPSAGRITRWGDGFRFTEPD